LIETLPDQPLANEARFELAELLAERNDPEPAMKLLNDALDKEPAPELTEKIRLRLGSILASKGKLQTALAHFDAVAKDALARDPKSPLVGWAQYRAGEALLQQQKYDDAIKRLSIFRDKAAFQNQPGLSDAALLRLGQACALAKDWNASRQALERLLKVFPNSPWSEEARRVIDWSAEQQKTN
jgi:tetratricopeptide (TPR) repeat protein